MNGKSLALRQDRSRLIHELITNHDVRYCDAERIVSRGMLDKITVPDALQRLAHMREALGDYISGTVLLKNPGYINFPVEQMLPLRDLLVGHGLNIAEAQRVIAMCMGLLHRDLHDVADTIVALDRLLTDPRANKSLILTKPETLLIPASHIAARSVAWENDPERFWASLVEGLDVRELAKPRPQPPAPRRVDLPLRPIFDRLCAGGVREEMAAKAAVRLSQLVGPRAIELLDAFTVEGWLMPEFVSLVQTRNNRSWQADPLPLFKAESDLMAALGIPQKDARRIVTMRQEYVGKDLTPVRSAADALRAGGLASDDIAHIARLEYRALFLPPERIVAWFAKVRSVYRRPMGSLGMLVRGWKTMEEDLRALQAPDASPPVEPMLAGIYLPPVPVERPPEPAPPPAPPQAPAVEHHPAINPPPAPPPQIDRPKINFFVPKPPFVPHIPKPPPPEDEDDDDLELQVDDDDDDEETDSHQRDWKTTIQRILALTADSFEAAQDEWESFRLRSENQSLWDPTATAPKALTHLALWTRMTEWPKGASKEVGFFGRILREPKLRPILTQTPEVLQHRLATIRKLLDRSFLEQPELLLLPFERVEAGELRYRVNELRARKGKIGDLFAEDRKAFHKVLDDRERIERLAEASLYSRPPVEPQFDPPFPVVKKVKKTKSRGAKKAARRTKKKNARR